MVAPVAATAVTVGQQAMKYARQYAPQAYQAAKEYVAKSGKSLESLASRAKDVNAQGAVLTALGGGGMDLAHFGQNSELTSGEQAILQQAMVKRGNAVRDLSDAAKHIKVENSFDAKFDFFALLESVVANTSISASSLYRLKLVLDRIDQKLVDEFLDKKRAGARFGS